MTLINRPDMVEVLGVYISAIDMAGAVQLCSERLRSGERGYVCVTGVHGVMEAQSDPEFRRILNHAFLCLPDGMPTVWIGHLRGYRRMRRVYGPDFMLEVCEKLNEQRCRHFLYGGNDGVAQCLKDRLCRRFPGLEIVGSYTPPFRQLNESEEMELIAMIEDCRPDVMWIGLSTPRQERFMAHYMERLNTKLLIGVGAAFDIHTGRINDAPSWVKRSGLQWLHRLIQEPRRLWKRYLINNPKFVGRVIVQLIRGSRSVQTSDQKF